MTRTNGRFILFLMLSLGVHGVIIGLTFIEWLSPVFKWGGGRKGVPVEVGLIWVTPQPSFPERYGEAVVEKTEEGAGSVIKNGEGSRQGGGQKLSSGEGHSLTPAGGRGEGYDPTLGRQGQASILDLIRLRVEHVKRYPLTARRRGIEGEVRLLFELQKNGTIRDIKVVQSSGSNILDDEAVATLKRAVPLPFYEGSLTLPLKFTLDE